MSFIKNEIPILEYDSAKQAVIMPNHENFDLELPRKAVFAFLGDAVDKYARNHGGEIVGWFESITKTYPIYKISYKGQELCLVQAPMGAPAAAQILDWLISYGVREIISGGSCGALENFKENEFLVPYRALRDEGTSYHYMAPSRYADVHPQARKAIEKTLCEHHLKYIEVMTWSTDGFYRETKEKVTYRKAEGCSVVEMECAALAACAEMRGAVWGELLYTADSLANIGAYDERNWGRDSVEYALELCMDAVLKIEMEG